MQFVVENVSSSGVRLGKLLWTSNGRNAAVHTLETPLCLLYTRAGFIPHLTDEIVDGVVESSSHAAMLTLPTMYELPGASVLSQFKEGIHRFLNKTEYFLYLAVQDPHAPPRQGFNEKKNVSVWTKLGRNKLTTANHLRLVESFRPNVFEPLCDTAPSAGNKLKRIKKSVDRTLSFLDETLAAREESKVLKECSILGAIEGSDIIEERRRSASETAKRPVDGFVLEGLDIEHSHEAMPGVIRTVTDLLPADKPRFIHGLHTSEDIFTAVENGVDILDSPYPHSATEKGCALVFPNCLLPRKRAGGVENNADSAATDEVKDLLMQPFEINLHDGKYASDFTPLLNNCQCYSCQHHTKAYVHHLLTTKEILAGVLLMTHNLFHFTSFFHNLRQALHNSTYSDFKRSCLQRLL